MVVFNYSFTRVIVYRHTGSDNTIILVSIFHNLSHRYVIHMKWSKPKLYDFYIGIILILLYRINFNLSVYSQTMFLTCQVRLSLWNFVESSRSSLYNRLIDSTPTKQCLYSSYIFCTHYSSNSVGLLGLINIYFIY